MTMPLHSPKLNPNYRLVTVVGQGVFTGGLFKTDTANRPCLLNKSHSGDKVYG